MGCPTRTQRRGSDVDCRLTKPYRVWCHGRIVFVLLVVGIPAAIAFGPGSAIGWVGTYLIPVAVITGVVIASLALLVWVVKRLPESPLRDWWQ